APLFPLKSRAIG
ncbi:hypothetical protein D046_1137B, partial [Vibrio parahaemolyticus V-223/04]